VQSGSTSSFVSIRRPTRNVPSSLPNVRSWPGASCCTPRIRRVASHITSATIGSGDITALIDRVLGRASWGRRPRSSCSRVGSIASSIPASFSRCHTIASSTAGPSFRRRRGNSIPIDGNAQAPRQIRFQGVFEADADVLAGDRTTLSTLPRPRALEGWRRYCDGSPSRVTSFDFNLQGRDQELARRRRVARTANDSVAIRVARRRRRIGFAESRGRNRDDVFGRAEQETGSVGERIAIMLPR